MMNKWLALSLLCVISLDLHAASRPSCEQAMAQIDADPSVPAEMKHHMHQSCAKAAAAEACDKKADKRNLVGVTRDRFMAECAGSPQPISTDRRKY